MKPYLFAVVLSWACLPGLSNAVSVVAEADLSTLVGALGYRTRLINGKHQLWAAIYLFHTLSSGLHSFAPAF